MAIQHYIMNSIQINERTKDLLWHCYGINRDNLEQDDIIEMFANEDNKSLSELWGHCGTIRTNIMMIVAIINGKYETFSKVCVHVHKNPLAILYYLTITNASEEIIDMFNKNSFKYFLCKEPLISSKFQFMVDDYIDINESTMETLINFMFESAFLQKSNNIHTEYTYENIGFILSRIFEAHHDTNYDCVEKLGLSIVRIYRSTSQNLVKRLFIIAFIRKIFLGMSKIIMKNIDICRGSLITNFCKFITSSLGESCRIIGVSSVAIYQVVDIVANVYIYMTTNALVRESNNASDNNKEIYDIILNMPVYTHKRLQKHFAYVLLSHSNMNRIKYVYVDVYLKYHVYVSKKHLCEILQNNFCNSSGTVLRSVNRRVYDGNMFEVLPLNITHILDSFLLVKNVHMITFILSHIKYNRVNHLHKYFDFVCAFSTGEEITRLRLNMFTYFRNFNGGVESLGFKSAQDANNNNALKWFVETYPDRYMYCKETNVYSVVPSIPCDVISETDGKKKKLKRKLDDAFVTDCPICLVNKCDRILTCSHSFCSKCIATVYNLNKTCSLCRKSFRKCLKTEIK
jgi:hypothetical protein